MKEVILRYWRAISSPSKHYSLGFLTLGGFVMGIIFWGGFNTALEFSSTEMFCTSCHEMEANVYQELQSTIHFTNRSGVRAKCSDCHVPHNWTDKMARKMQASKEVWGKIFGTINTREKFLAKRRELAEREWHRLKTNDSLECRNCHDFEYMDFVAAHDVGRAINPALCEGQIEGSIHMGLGYALTEDLPCPDGMPATFKLREIGVSRAREMPEVEVHLVEDQEPEGPFGAKGVGEIGLVPTAGAVAAALEAHDGVRRYVLPMKDSAAARALKVGRIRSLGQ